MRTESIRRATILLVALASAAAVSIAQAAPRGVNRVEPKLVRVTEPQLVRVPIEDVGDLQVRVWTEPGEGSLVFPGEDVRVRFRVDDDAYVAIYDIDTMGRVRLLFPESPYDDGYVRGGRVVNLPGRGAGYRLMVSGPAGVERIVALASERPLAGRWRRFAENDLIGASDRDRAYDGGSDGEAGFHTEGVDQMRRDGTLGPQLVKVPATPRLIPVPVSRDGLARDETWLRVGRAARRY